MMRPKLVLPAGYHAARGWNWTLCRMLADSGVFRIEERDFPSVRVPGTRNANWSLMELKGLLIGLDTWDTYAPTGVYATEGVFDGPLRDVRLILKLQYYPCGYWKGFQDRRKIPVKPWVIMPTRGFPLGDFQWKSSGHRWIGTVTGKNNRFGRAVWSDWCAKQEDFYSSGRYVVEDTTEEFVGRLQSCRWGIILRGRPDAVKNRRECEFTSCGMPLALNYEPYYEFPMEPGVHYVKLEAPDDLAKLRDIDPEPYAGASRELYETRFSPLGAAQTLLELVDSFASEDDTKDP